MSRSVLAGLLLSSLLAPGCNAPPPKATSATSGQASTASAAVSIAPVAPPARTVIAGPPRPDGKPAAPANLLDLVPASVGVSSAVVNPYDFPEHLIDGKRETAWNGKTGDLHGWIAFRVPDDAHIERIELTVGYDRVKGKVDLFTANHRIKRAALFRDGKKIQELSFDIAKRDLQPIDVNGPGGLYRIEVLETEPGTKKEWRELVVSELRVIGRPGTELRAPNTALRVLTGDPALETPEPQALDFEAYGVSLRGDNVTALCQAYVAWANQEAVPNTLERKKWDTSITVGTPTCVERSLTTPFAPSGAYMAVTSVRTFDSLRSQTSLVVRTARGFFLTPVSWDADDPTDPGCPSIIRIQVLDELKVDNGYFVAVVGGDRLTYLPHQKDPDPGYRTELLRTAYWGKDDGKEFGFRYWNLQYQSVSLGSKVQPHWDYAKRVPWASLPWKDAKPFHISPQGLLQPQG